jgi:SAM-dependent methyltransferase
MVDDKEFVIPKEESHVTYQENIWRYYFASNFILNKVVLDVASGAGHGADYMAKKGAKDVFGVDYSDLAIKYSKNHYSKENLHFICSDATSLPFEDKFFDVIVSFETIEHIKNYKKFIKEVSRVLKKNGVLILSTPNKELSPSLIMPKNWYHEHEFYPNELYHLLGKNFFEVQLYSQRNVNPVPYILKNRMIIIISRLIGSRTIYFGKILRKIGLIKTSFKNEHDFENDLTDKKLFGVKNFSKSLLDVPMYIICIAKK